MDLNRFPRRKYTTAHETPIEYLPHLSRALQKDDDNDENNNMVHLWIKRDDQLGLAGGGNKTRKLEFVMADAIQQNNNTIQNLTIITSGAVQSNHCRLTLAACNQEGIRSCILVLEERVSGSYKPEASGNNYLFHLLGAERMVHVGLGEAPSMVDQIANELREQGRNVYVIPGGASNEIGATGYCACAAEIQVR
jgi:D-cysteine desulfhydrase